MEYGLLGKVLAHSFSPEIHALIGDYEYKLIELTEDKVEAFLSERDFKAINVTIPYKQTVIPYLDEISESAKAIGAVNTVVKCDGKLYGYNTDFDGLKALIQSLSPTLENLKVLIFGSGGTSRTAKAVAKAMGAKEVVVVGRTSGEDVVSYDDAKSLHSDADFIINTTPCGMYPNVHTIAMDLDVFTNLKAVADVVYNPLRTELVMRAKEKGIPAKGGLYMLTMQGIKAAEYFFGKEIESEKAEDIFNTIIKRRENIVLTGMPSSGKTTVGNILSKEMNRPFYDVDELIVNHAGCKISEIFERYGEEYFRDLESAVIAEEVAPLTGAIIATGGGAILRKENVKNLKKNGKVIFLDRDLSLLTPTADRPTASDLEAMKKRFEQRYEIYNKTADIKVDGSLSAEEVASIVKEEFLK
ncbi:MAG: shikimate dehydrogenase [Clostridia bacterium]|nr:shikimate dehydrogenase [Clostridia bacterium]